MLGDIFHFYSNSNRTFCEQKVETLIGRRDLTSDLGLGCLPMSHKKDARAKLSVVTSICFTIVNELCRVLQSIGVVDVLYNRHFSVTADLRICKM